MYNSPLASRDIIFNIYRDRQTVFRLKDIAMLMGHSDFQSLNKKLNYYVHTGRLLNPRKGIYAKPGYRQEELACHIFTPSYLSLEYVLQRSGVIFQYDSTFTSVSYLSRIIEAEGMTFRFRKIKGDVLVNTAGIGQLDGPINMATPERAFLDTLYLNREYYFDNLKPINPKLVHRLLPVYQSKALSERVNKLLESAFDFSGINC